METNQLNKKKSLAELMDTAAEPGISNEEAMNLKQIEQAKNGDTRSYIALMDLRYVKKIGEEAGNTDRPIVFNVADKEDEQLIKNT